LTKARSLSDKPASWAEAILAKVFMNDARKGALFEAGAIVRLAR
jgi:hypothetical protein